MPKATTVRAFLASLDAERRTTIEEARRIVLEHLPKGFEETIVYGMIGYVIPLSRFPDTYNGQPLMLAGIASQKNYVALHMMGAYMNPPTRKILETGFKRAGKKLDMGKGCLRFKSVDDLALEVVGDAIGSISADAYIAIHDSRLKKKPKPVKKAPKK